MAKINIAYFTADEAQKLQTKSLLSIKKYDYNNSINDMPSLLIRYWERRGEQTLLPKQGQAHTQVE